jgi:putative endonuclease
MEQISPWCLYIVRCSDNSLYTGITTDINRRLNEHNSGIGSKYTRSRLPVELVYTNWYINRSVASKSEAAIKKLTKAKKEELIAESDQLSFWKDE